MRRGKQLTWTGKLAMWVVIVFIIVFIVFTFLGPVLFRSDLRYERGSYRVLKDRAITSCVVKNYGRRSAERVRMSVEFLSKILDIRISPESGREIIEVAPSQLSAVIELENIAPKGEVTISFAVERLQRKPFDIHLLDIGGKISPRERSVPIR